MKVIILSDNRPGHYKQSLGIVQKLSESQAEWVEIQFRHKWRDNLLRVFMCIFGGMPIPVSLIHTLLKWSLVPESYNALTRLETADLVLSTGSSVATVNLLLGRILGAKTVTCRRPSPVGVRYFDLAILPMISWHSAVGKSNICKTIGVPNPISPDMLDAERERLKHELNLPDCQRIGILLGGTDRHETITTADAVKLSEICEAVAAEMNATGIGDHVASNTARCGGAFVINTGTYRLVSAIHCARHTLKNCRPVSSNSCSKRPTYCDSR